MKVAFEAKMSKATVALKSLTVKYQNAMCELRGAKENMSDLTFSPSAEQSTKKYTPQKSPFSISKQESYSSSKNSSASQMSNVNMEQIDMAKEIITLRSCLD